MHDAFICAQFLIKVTKSELKEIGRLPRYLIVSWCAFCLVASMFNSFVTKNNYPVFGEGSIEIQLAMLIAVLVLALPVFFSRLYGGREFGLASAILEVRCGVPRKRSANGF